MAFTLYQIKPRFQNLLRPLVRWLAAAGMSANQVTLAACAVSLVFGLGLYFHPEPRLFAVIPLWMLLRMAMNAIDGMLAREHHQASRLGAYLNEICDVLADAALFLPLAAITPFNPLAVGVVIVLAAVSELAGVLGQTIGASRRYDGPMGKSDRALLLGVLSLWIALATLPAWVAWVLPAAASLILWNIVNRIRNALAEAQTSDRGAAGQ